MWLPSRYVKNFRVWPTILEGKIDNPRYNLSTLPRCLDLILLGRHSILDKHWVYGPLRFLPLGFVLLKSSAILECGEFGRCWVSLVTPGIAIVLLYLRVCV